MDAELKAKWVAALRSGKYEQGHFELMTRADNSYCCLGVLCEVISPGYLEELEQDDLETSELPEFASRHAGLPGDEQIFLARLNDEDHKSFVQIADYIEANL